MKLYARLNLYKFLVFFQNIFLSYVFFFCLRRFFLRLFGFSIGEKVSVHWGVRFFSFGKCSIGNNVTINYGCYLDNRAGIYIGNNVNISHNVRIYSLGHNINSSSFATVGKPVVVEDNVWIFPNVLIMPGVVLGAGSVVLPGSVVTKSVSPNDVVAGNPARVIRKRVCAPDYLIDYPVWFAV